MGVMSIQRLLLTMAIPMMLSMMVQALYNIVDSIFVARLNENALTAVTLTFPIQNLMIAIAVGTGVGINAFLSKSLGEKNFDAVNKSAMNGLLLVWISSAVFMLIGFLFSEVFFRAQTNSEEIIEYGKDYLSVVCIFSCILFSQITFERLLTSTGKTFYAMISQAAGAIINIILDPLLIFGLAGFPAMAVKGAAIATVIGQSAGTAIGLYFNLKVNREIRLSLKNLKPNKAIIRRIYSVGAPSILMASVGSVMLYGFNKILISFTATAIAVFGVFFKLQSFVFMPVFGLNNAMVPILAYNYGAGKKDRIIKTIKLGLLYSSGVMLAGFIAFELFPAQLLLLFNAAEEMLSIGVTAFRTLSLVFLFAGFSIVFISVFQALGDGMASLCISVARQLGVLLPAAWFLSLSGVLNTVWWAFPAAECVSLVLSIVFMKRMYNKTLRLMKENVGAVE
ncbi:MAG: MATE family efflux transporter [Treponema sp.]|nr:MATE family efflux transporter [Treponema sp.]